MGEAENTQDNHQASPNVTGNTYSSLKTQCDELGISVAKLCREANVDRSLLVRWRNKEPNTLKIYNALLQALSRIQSRNHLPIKKESHENS